mmetsp:Transcript_24956/g.27909  ORF Transcript_24956/g.27909 Transcript_24956/m.27909 type:complete len:593 (-) Transcript_24956:44-1822(-)
MVMIINISTILLLVAISRTTAKPSDYWDDTTDAVISQRDDIYALRTVKAAGDKNPEQWLQSTECKAKKVNFAAGTTESIQTSVPSFTPETDLTEFCGDASDDQNMWFTENGCSKASVDMTYIDRTGNVRTAKKGEIIDMHCESVFCPPPKVPDCYNDPSYCASDEWCMLNQQEVWKQASGIGGGTPGFAFCNKFFNSSEWTTDSVDDYYRFVQQTIPDITQTAAIDVYKSAKERCNATDGSSEGVNVVASLRPFYGKGSRGRCVKYRQEGQSCVPQSVETNTMTSVGPKMVSGKQFKRPLLCDTTKGLHCTSSDFDVLPSTCVQERPQDICFHGPWYDSSICPRTETKVSGGMDYEWTLKTVRNFLLLFHTDTVLPTHCNYWDRSTPTGQAAYNARVDSYAIVAALWPTHLGGDFASLGLPSFDQFEEEFILPNVPWDKCDAGSKDPDKNACETNILAMLGIATERANYIWSLIHFMMHNQPDSMNANRIAASRQLAVHLSTNFWCSNCRTYFTVGVLETFGLPPNSNNPEDHAKYWNFGHNIAGEHVSTTRGDDPWQYQAGEEIVADMQNPYYVSYERSKKQWTYNAAEKE